MKKIAVVLALMILSLAAFVPFTVYTQSAQAQTGGYSIQTVTHEIRVLYSGQIVITDTLQISGTMPSSIQIGFPFQYESYVIEVEAYDSNNNELRVTTDVPLQDRSGFYGTTIDLSGATGNVVKVIFIFSNGMLTYAPTGYSLNYPAYPALTTPASTVNATLALPAGATLRGIDKQDGAVNTTSYTVNNLAAFTSIAGNASFVASTDLLTEASVPSLDRSISVNPSGTVTCTDRYTISNNGEFSLSFFKLNLPLDATNIVARDQFGRTLSLTTSDTPGVTKVANITLVQAVSTGSLIEISIDYNLPIITPQQAGIFVLNLDLYPYFNYYVESLSVTITPPEGATLVSQPSTGAGNIPVISRNAFQETMTITRAGITYTNTLYNPDTLQVTYNYNPLWIAFRPTIWMWAITAVGAAVVAFMLRPKAKTKTKVAPVTISAPVAAAVGVSADQIRTFVDAYEEKIQINAEIRSLEVRVQRGRIPRRRYKERRANLQSRLDSLDKTTNGLKAILRSSGGSHTDIIRQLESAEVNFNETNRAIATLEAQRNVGEISIEAYKQQLAELERRKNKAESIINGLMLRLRGEIR